MDDKKINISNMSNRRPISHRLFSDTVASNDVEDESKNGQVVRTLGRERSTKTIDEKGDSLLVIRGDNQEEIKINLTEIHKNLEHLKLRSAQFIKTLSETDQQSFNHIVALRNGLAGTNMLSHVDDIIRDVFKDIKNVLPGTVGAYFIGCYLNTNFNGPHACSAICAGSAAPEDGTPGWEACHQPSFLYDGKGTFNLLNDVPNREKGLIFMSGDISFAGFTGEDIAKLRAYGVKQAKLITYKNGTEYHEVSNYTEIEKLPLRNANRSVTNKRQAMIKQEVKERLINNRDIGGFGSFIIFLAIIVILGLIIYILYRNRNRVFGSPSPSASYRNGI